MQFLGNDLLRLGLGTGPEQLTGVMVPKLALSVVLSVVKLGTNSVLPIDYLVKPFPLDEFALEVRVAMEFVRRRKLRCR
ncbi:MAG: hypothetical protein NT167_22605 [Verrucomicrobia bacterium]|nr:hypothetical protein [Verrucomicrobiota bacterium]